MKNVLIVEDHPFVAEATKALLATMAVDEATVCRNADEVCAALERETGWFRILLDIGVPGAQGLSLVRRVHRAGMAGRAAVITASDSAQWQIEVDALGFLGYVLKTASVDEFSFALQEIFAGRRCFGKRKTDAQPTHLTRRQTEILRLLHGGLTTKNIARELNLSPGTVDNHVAAILCALRANDRTHAVARGISLGYIECHEA